MFISLPGILISLFPIAYHHIFWVQVQNHLFLGAFFMYFLPVKLNDLTSLPLQPMLFWIPVFIPCIINLYVSIIIRVQWASAGGKYAFIFVYPGLAKLPPSQEHEFWKQENHVLNLGLLLAKPINDGLCVFRLQTPHLWSGDMNGTQLIVLLFEFNERKKACNIIYTAPGVWQILAIKYSVNGSSYYNCNKHFEWSLRWIYLKE